jgi:hypothetical protein
MLQKSRRNPRGPEAIRDIFASGPHGLCPYYRAKIAGRQFRKPRCLRGAAAAARALFNDGDAASRPSAKSAASAAAAIAAVSQLCCSLENSFRDEAYRVKT